MRCSGVVGRPGFEPGTYGLKVHSSAIELAARACQGTWAPSIGRNRHLLQHLASSEPLTRSAAPV